MSEFKGTKGEWTAKQKRLDIIEIHDDSVEGVSIIGQVYSGFGVTDEQGKANAQLISCAPEMLEMLKFIYDAVDWSTEVWGNDAGQKHKSKMEQLIKKATTI